MINLEKPDLVFSSLRVHHIKGYIENIILIEHDHGLLLLDSGCISDVKRIAAYCRKVLQRSPSDIKLTAVTHMHPDHGGGAVCLRKRYGIPVAAHENADLWYQGLGGALQHKLDCYMASSVAFRNRRRLERILYNRRINPDSFLQDGQSLPFFPEWQVIHVPGHTIHDLAFYNKQEQVLYIADLICDVKGKPQLPLPIVFPRQMAKSYDRLGATQAKVILRAHGDPIITDDSSRLFGSMKELLFRPPTPFMKRIWKMSIYSPEFKKGKNYENDKQA